MKNVIKDFIFVIIFIVLLHICSNIFVLKGNTYGSDVTSFYNLEKDSLDIIFFGSSHSYATFSPDIIKEETGYESYNFATQQQPIYITYHYMVEALKTQKPTYFALEAKMLADGAEYTTEGVVRDAIDKMHFSKNKIDAINVSVKDKDDRLSYYINIIKYHSRYSELTKNDLIDGIKMEGINNKGFKKLNQNFEVNVNNEEFLQDNKEMEISRKNLEYLDKIIELAEENDIKLILAKSPCQLTKEEQEKYNWVENYAESHNLDFINYNYYFKELGLEDGDFYDAGHVSYTGAEKVSKNFSKYLLKL